eukprot:10601897-Heterocapsa_arctica.AAC.1
MQAEFRRPDRAHGQYAGGAYFAWTGEEAGPALHSPPPSPPSREPSVTMCAIRSCGRTFPAIPDPIDGYIHKHCCSKCKYSAGKLHSRRCAALSPCEHSIAVGQHSCPPSGRNSWQAPSG